MQFNGNLGIDLPQDPVLEIYPKDISSYYRDTCLTIFIAALIIIASIWKHSRCQSTDEWIIKRQCIHQMKYYSIFKNEIIKLKVNGWS